MLYLKEMRQSSRSSVQPHPVSITNPYLFKDIRPQYFLSRTQFPLIYVTEFHIPLAEWRYIIIRVP